MFKFNLTRSTNCTEELCINEYFTFLPLLTSLSLCQLWDIRSGQCHQTFTGHESDINAVSVSNQLFLVYTISI